MPTALIVGNTDGIGLALTKLLLAQGFAVVGISRRASDVDATAYEHHVLDVGSEHYVNTLRDVVASLAELTVCIYCAGIGELLTTETLHTQLPMFRVNLLGAIATAEIVMPRFLAAKQGHFIGLSSQGDTLLDPAGAGYAASKAALTTYLEGLAFVCRAHGVSVTNVRLGFVQTKMAKASVRPFMVSVETAAEHIRRCMRSKPIRSTFPRRLVPLLWLLRLRVVFARG